MALVIADRVKETTTTNGVGPLSLGGAMTGFRPFSGVCTVSDTCYYAAQAVDSSGVPTGAWEVGLGTYSAVNTLTRTTILSSSNGGAAVSFASGTKQVWLDLAASDYLNTRAAALAAAPPQKLTILQRTADQAITGNTWTAVSYDTNTQDDVGAFSSGTPTHITVPAGYTKMRVVSYTVWQNSGAGQRLQALEKNGATTLQLAAQPMQYESGATLVSRWLTVTAGDYFRIMVNAGSSINLSGTGFAGPSYIQVEWLP